MNLIEFLQDLTVKGWKFWSEDDGLHYRAPKEALDSALLARLKEHKAEILELLQATPDLLNVYPLSYGQRSLWFLWQLASESHAYNVAFSARICSVVDISAMKKAFEALIERHPILRTTFPQRRSEPIQQVHRERELNFLEIDATTWSEEELKARVIEANQLPFDLETGSVMRVCWFVRSQEEHILLLTIHHIACDRWSSDILIQELPQLYQEKLTAIPSSLTPLKHDYQDYVRWQRKNLSGTQGEKLWNYWQEQLAGDLPVLNLPTDRQRSPIQTFNGGSYNFALSSPIISQLRELAQKSQTTFYTILLAAFQVFLYHYTGQKDILVGSPTSGRSRGEFAPIVGYFVDPVVIRADLANNPSFQEFLSQIRHQVLRAIAHQDYPFALLAEKLLQNRDPSRSPIYQVSFALQQLKQSQNILGLLENQTQQDVDWGGIKLRPFEIPQQEGRFDLDLDIVEGSSSVFGVLKYNTDLFDSETIPRMAANFQHLLEEIVANPSQKVGEINILSPAESDRILNEWNNTAVEYPQDKYIHQLFEEQVEKNPNSIAVVFEDRQLTYKQLNQRTNQLAHHLKSLGVKPETLVGICVERSIEMLVGLLGILKAGGAYVPLDPSYPKERLDYMLTDSQLPILLTQQHLLNQLPEHQAQTISLDRDGQNFSKYSPDNLPTQVKADNLAYVIYTSGSTGKPKGTMIPHQGMVNYLSWCINAYDVAGGEGSLVNSSISFDATITSLFSPLLVGRKVVLLPTEGEIEALKTALCSGTKFSLVKITPAHLEILSHLCASEAVNIKTQAFIIGGEALSTKVTAFWQKHAPSIKLINEYGPTETVVGCCVYSVGEQNLIDSNIPIGKPIANTQIYILDEHLQPVPVGVAGEIYIGGDGLARGYLNRPELTKERFINPPAFGTPLNKGGRGDRLYKTGDLARYLPSGEIEYLGRIDNQVKIRGFRIELGEIETILATHPQIQQVVVIAREDSSGNKRLVAYLVTQQESISHSQLREYLKQKLPEYMIPSSFVVLEKLPLTPNGKIDRKALPATDGEITRETEYLAPRNQIEQTLVNIWQELLLVENISITDNFFEIGGDSILSIQVVSRAKAAGIQITPKQIFQNQTIERLATVANTTATVIAQQGIVTGVAPLTPIQKWFFTQNLSQAHHFNQSVILEIPSDTNPELLKTALTKLVSHHDALRLRLNSEAEEYQQTNYGVEENILFAIADLTSIPLEKRSQVIGEIATKYQGSLNLNDGLLIKAVLFNFGSETNSRFLIIIHHLVVDGVSWRILLSDLETIYQQLIAEQPIQLSSKTTAFIDWAEKLNNYAQQETIKQELDYWLNQFPSNTRSLPVDNADIQIESENTVGNASIYQVKLNKEKTTALLGEVNEAYNTQINDLLLSALVISLSQWTKNSQVLIDLEGHGREEELIDSVDLSRTVGWFTSLFPVLLQLPTEKSEGLVIKSIKEQLRVIPHRGIGYGILRYLSEDITIKQQLESLPQPEILFNYLGQFDQIESQTETGWKFASESTGENNSPKQTRHHLLEINSLIVKGELLIDWTYNSQIHHSTTVEKLATEYLQTLESIIEHCQSEENWGYTPSDFPEAELNQAELEDLLALINQ